MPHPDWRGAFHRACRTREWGAPDTARLLDVQADLAALFLEASVALGEEAYAERARAAIGYVTATLAAADGGFFQSEGEHDADGGAVDRILVTPANARMVRTLLRAAEVLHAPHLAEAAMAAVETIVPLAYAAGAGVAHYLTDGSPRVRGLLVDQVETSAALVDLSHASGNHVYRELAEELMRSCLRKLWHEGSGGFLDRLRTPSGGGDIGRMADPLVPYSTNCEAARVLARLARETGDDELRVKARETLAALRPVYREQGVMSAEYALALGEVTAGVQA